MSDLRAKVTSVYDEFRDSELNKRYYGYRVFKTRKKLRNIDIYLALFAAGSAVAGFGLWRYEFLGFAIGQMLLGMFAGIAVVLAIAKPYLKIEDEIERLSAIQGSYDSLSHILKDIVERIKAEHAIDESDYKVFWTLRQIRATLGHKEDKPADRKIVQVAQDEVNELYPVGNFWWPQSEPRD